jgi:WD40 repeat protein
VITAFNKALLLIWDTASGETRMLMNSESSYGAVAFCPNTHLVAIAQENLITIIDLDEFRKPAELTLTGGSIADMAFAPDGSALAATNADGLIAVWQISN